MVSMLPERGVDRRKRCGVAPYCTPPPLLDEYRCLGQCVEDLSVQELVSQFAVEALVVAVLPRTARRDVEGLDPQPGQPSPHQFRREPWPVVRAQMLGRTVPSEEIGEHLENVVSSSLSTDLDRQTLPRVLVSTVRSFSARPSWVRVLTKS